jgi:hypothetical protein
MIAQVLSRSFVLSWLDAVEQTLPDLVAESGDPAGDYAAALDGIEQVKQSGVPGQPDDSETDRRSGRDDATALEEASFFSRDPVTSLLQSAVEELIETKYAGLIVEDGDSTDRRDAAAPVAAVTDRKLDIGDLQFDSDRRLFGPFEITDVRWVASVGLAKALQMWRDRHPFNPEPAAPVQLAERARLVLVGDWGSGLPRAQQIAQHMRVAIDDGIADGRQVHAIHLGDVYYSGFAREYKNRFLRYWPVHEHEAGTVYSWSLNGNHDMYSGGHGYFKTLLADPRFACQQQSSWFSIENQHWRIAGIDTAWDEQGIHDPRTERGLADPQAAKLQEWARADDRPFMLLSHHQLFSGYEKPGPSLRKKLAPLLDDGRIRAWFWGHEHRCVVHQPYEGVEYGRCLGHGGVPVYAVGTAETDEPRIDWVEQRFLDGLVEHWALFGFAIADFDGPDVVVRYIDENNELAYEESFSAR